MSVLKTLTISGTTYTFNGAATTGGSSVRPVYFNNEGNTTQCTYTLNTNIPASPAVTTSTLNNTATQNEPAWRAAYSTFKGTCSWTPNITITGSKILNLSTAVTAINSTATGSTVITKVAVDNNNITFTTGTINYVTGTSTSSYIYLDNLDNSNLNPTATNVYYTGTPNS